MKVHISEAPRTQQSARWMARYAQLGTTGVATESHEDPISLADTTYRVILNCLANSDSKDFTTNGRCESATEQPFNMKEEVKS